MPGPDISGTAELTSHGATTRLRALQRGAPTHQSTPTKVNTIMYNGIGLTTPRGSGTNGYVVRNLSAVRSHQSVQDRASAWDAAPPKHREPDAEILEHERKRKVEVKCLELQLKLEEDGLDEEKIEEQVSALRTKLLAEASALVQNAKALKPSDTHGIAAAKKDELNKMARALGTRRDYNEGDAFDREKQEELRMRRIAEREERERQKEEERAKMLAQKERWEAERKEKERLRRREEDRRRKEREEEFKRRDRMPPPPVPSSRGGRDYDRRSRSRSPVRRAASPGDDRDYRRRRRSPSPARRRPASRSPSSPPARVRRRFESRSPSRSRSPPPRYRRSGSVEPPSRGQTGLRRSPSPYAPKSPPRAGRGRRSPSRSVSRSRSPVRRDRSPNDRGRENTRSPSPPAPGERGPRRRGRSRSSSSDSSMSVSSGSSRSRD
ncbi:cwf21 domain-containing protein [Earliella scabrosa]|nr:cwf21 domain-containing protein [Earliella scabrosa]